MNYYKINGRLAAINFDILASSVNGTEGRPVLRKHHREYLMELVRMANMQAYAQARDTGTSTAAASASLSTNSVQLAKTIGCCPRTIRNYNEILERYGVLSRTFHGTVRNYDITLNEYICPVVNVDNSHDYPMLAEADRGSVRERTAAAVLRFFFDTAKRQNLPHRYMYIDTLNNEKKGKGVSDGNKSAVLLTTSADTASEGASVQRTAACIATLAEYVDLLVRSGIVAPMEDSDSLDTCIDTGAENETEATTEQEQAAPAVCPEVEALNESEEELAKKNLDEYKAICARMLFSYALDRIPGWKGRIYPGVADEVTLRIKEQYFDDLANKWQCNYILGVAYQTIQMASRYIRRRLMNGRWNEFRMMPPTYFDINNPRGFAAFYSKILAAENDRLRRKSVAHRSEALKHYEHERKVNNMKLNKILKSYFDRPTADNYQRCLALVKQTMPQRLTMFQNCVADARRRQAAFYKRPQNEALSPKLMK